MFIEFIKQAEEKQQDARLCQAAYSFFHNKFNKFNNIQARMQDSIYHTIFICDFTVICNFWPLVNLRLLLHNITGHIYLICS